MVRGKIERDAGAERDGHPGAAGPQPPPRRAPIDANASRNGGQLRPSGTNPPAGAASRGGQVPA
jgi:hypothetical protein